MSLRELSASENQYCRLGLDPLLSHPKVHRAEAVTGQLGGSGVVSWKCGEPGGWEPTGERDRETRLLLGAVMVGFGLGWSPGGPAEREPVDVGCVGLIPTLEFRGSRGLCRKGRAVPVSPATGVSGGGTWWSRNISGATGIPAGGAGLEGVVVLALQGADSDSAPLGIPEPCQE